MHDSPLGGHSGQQGTYHRLKQCFYWQGMKRDVIAFVKECDICQKCKKENVAYPGLLQPLQIPEQAWQSISMDFIEGLPNSHGKEVILVVVDRFTKYGHFISLSHPFTAEKVAEVFMENIYKLHGIPQNIVSDKDKIFLSRFWQFIFKQMKVELSMSSTYHPQSDGQTKRVNRCLETYLRCMVFQRPKTWNKWLHLAEHWYNTNFHTSLKCSPFHALYGYLPPDLAFEVMRREEDCDWFRERAAMIAILRENLMKAQARMKQQADKHRSERILEVGDWVYLKVQPYKQVTMAVRANVMLASKYYGPFQVLERVGAVAYRLKLPPGTTIHPVIHVSQLKKRIGSNVVPQVELPEIERVGLS